jgi:hypothetical protein
MGDWFCQMTGLSDTRLEQLDTLRALRYMEAHDLFSYPGAHASILNYHSYFED